MQIKDAIRLKRPTLVFKKNGSSINMLLPGNKKKSSNHLQLAKHNINEL